MPGEQLTPNPSERTLVHGQEPIIVSQPGDPGHEANVAVVEENLATQQAAADLMRSATDARQAVAEAQLARPLGPGAITEGPPTSTSTTTEAPKSVQNATPEDLAQLEAIKADGRSRRHRRYFMPWTIVTDRLRKR